MMDAPPPCTIEFCDAEGEHPCPGEECDQLLCAYHQRKRGCCAGCVRALRLADLEGHADYLNDLRKDEP